MTARRPQDCPCRGCHLARRGITETVPHRGAVEYAGQVFTEGGVEQEIVTVLRFSSAHHRMLVIASPNRVPRWINVDKPRPRRSRR